MPEFGKLIGVCTGEWYTMTLTMREGRKRFVSFNRSYFWGGSFSLPCGHGGVGTQMTSDR